MARQTSTDRSGNSFSEETKRVIWNKAKIVTGQDPTITRKDLCGALISWDKYGNTTENGNGWEIDHIKPVSKGGGDELNNLQALQWQNNRKKGDDYPASNYCIISAK